MDVVLQVVDVQKDFCPGGALPIECGDEVVPVINRWMRSAQEVVRRSISHEAGTQGTI